MSSALRGHLDLVCARDDAGRTALARQSFAAPMHLSKPYWDGHHLVINAVNPTAGLFSGDEVEIAVRVESGASALFTSPSASRVHRARDGEPAAFVRQTFSVARDGWLEVCPEMLIAQAGARYEQHTRLEVEPGGGLLYFDSLAPGRVASGEIFAFEHVRVFTRLLVGGDLLAAETCRLAPADDSLAALRVHHAHSYHATWFAVFPAAPPTDLRTAFPAAPELLIGASQLDRHALVGKILAAHSVALRRGIDAVRTACYAALGRPRPAWRKL
jgi:urease accessory protein